MNLKIQAIKAEMSTSKSRQTYTTHSSMMKPTLATDTTTLSHLMGRTGSMR